MNVIFLNGPPRSGKDTAAKIIREVLRPIPSQVNRLSDRMKMATHMLYKAPLTANHFERVKDTRLDTFFELTPREAYINMFRFLSEQHGPTVLGRMLVQDLLRHFENGWPGFVVVPDAGRAEDCRPLIERVGSKNVQLIRLKREGCSYVNDCRVTVDLADLEVATHDVDNDGSLADLERTLSTIVRR